MVLERRRQLYSGLQVRGRVPLIIVLARHRMYRIASLDLDKETVID